MIDLDFPNEFFYILQEHIQHSIFFLYVIYRSKTVFVFFLIFWIAVCLFYFLKNYNSDFDLFSVIVSSLLEKNRARQLITGEASEPILS